MNPNRLPYLSLLPMALGTFSIALAEISMMGLLPYIMADYQVSTPVAGQTISVYALGVVIGAPLLVTLFRRFSLRQNIRIFMLLFVLFHALVIVAPNYHLLLIARFFGGLPHGAFFGVSSVICVLLFPPGYGARAMSLVFAGFCVAIVFAVPMVTWLAEFENWRVAYGTMIVSGLLSLVLITPLIPEVSAIQPPSSLNAPTESAQHPLNHLQEPHLLLQPVIWLMIVLISLGTAGFFAWFSYISPILTEVSGFAITSVPWVLFIVGVGMLIGNFIGGYLADRLNPALVVALLFLFVAILVFLFATYSSNQITVVILGFIVGLVVFAYSTPVQSLTIMLAKGNNMSLAASLGQSCFNIGNSLGAALGGLPIAYGLSVVSSNYVGVIMALLGSLLSFWMYFIVRYKPSTHR